MKSVRFHLARQHLRASFTICNFICLFALGGHCSAAAAARLTPGVPLLVPVGTPLPVRMAVADLQRDLEKVLGQPSPIVEDTKEPVGRPAIVILANGATSTFP